VWISRAEPTIWSTTGLFFGVFFAVGFFRALALANETPWEVGERPTRESLARLGHPDAPARGSGS
jgi:hypothetical protein